LITVSGTAHFVAGVAREVAFARDEFLDPAGESVQRARQGLDVAVGIARQAFGRQRGEVRLLRIPVAHDLGQRDDRRKRAPRGTVSQPGRDVDDDQHEDQRHEAEQERQPPDLLLVEHQVQAAGGPVGDVREDSRHARRARAGSPA
jgi:hypothetical protein